MTLLQQRLSAPLSVLALLVTATLLVVGCDTTVEDESTTVEPEGTVTGRVIDNATSAPIQGVTVALAAPDEVTEEDTTRRTATTDAQGEFAIEDVPVNTQAGASSSSTTYSLHITTPSDSPYRPFYRGEVELTFSATDGVSASNLSASATFPLSKTNGTVSGRVVSNDGPLRNAEIGLVQNLPVQTDGDGNPTNSATVLANTATTGSDGSFTLSNAEVGTDFDLVLLPPLGAGEQFDADFYNGRVPSSGQGASVDAGTQDVTGVLEPFRITNVVPAPGTDVGSTTPSVVFTFNRPVVDNPFTQNELAEELDLTATTSKTLRADGNYPLDVSFDSTRTQLTVTPSEPLADGYNYAHDATGGGVGLLGGEGFDRNLFTDVHGVTLTNATVGDFSFSVGANTNAPGTPSVAFQDGEKPTLNYNDDVFGAGGVEADLEITNVPDTLVKEYEVYARTADLANERTGEGGQFKLLETVSADQSAFGTLEFTASIDDTFNGDRTPLHDDRGNYAAIEWKVRAVSINNVRGSFTDVITTPDNDSLDFADVDASPADFDNDGEDELVVEFNEPVDASTVSASDFTVFEDGQNTEANALTGSPTVENIRTSSTDPTRFEGRVAFEFDPDYTLNSNDDLVIQGITDLEGNPVVPNENADVGTPIDQDIGF
jgi:hypothetical protein